MNFENFLNTTFAQYKETANLNCFKKVMLNQMNLRADKLRATGLQDERVLFDLVTDAYGDVETRYQNFHPSARRSVSLWDLTSKRSAFSL